IFDVNAACTDNARACIGLVRPVSLALVPGIFGRLALKLVAQSGTRDAPAIGIQRNDFEARAGIFLYPAADEARAYPQPDFAVVYRQADRIGRVAPTRFID